MDNLLLYAPCALFVITTIVSMRIFARTGDVKAMEAKLMTYAMEHFVTRDIYADNHKALQSQMLQIQHDISEVKTILINISSQKGG